ncbi:hypothetical protein BKA93DRAFT_475191 [Sparassis latifolia]
MVVAGCQLLVGAYSRLSTCGVGDLDSCALSLPMHPLLNDDVLRRVFDFPKQARDNPTLVRSAQVSRAFSEPALDALWDVTDLLRLVRLLDVLSTVHSVRNYGLPLTKYVVEKEPSPEQWERFHSYARRVHSLYISISLFDSKDPSAVAALIIERSRIQIFTQPIHLHAS